MVAAEDGAGPCTAGSCRCRHRPRRARRATTPSLPIASRTVAASSWPTAASACAGRRARAAPPARPRVAAMRHVGAHRLLRQSLALRDGIACRRRGGAPRAERSPRRAPRRGRHGARPTPPCRRGRGRRPATPPGAARRRCGTARSRRVPRGVSETPISSAASRSRSSRAASRGGQAVIGSVGRKHRRDEDAHDLDLVSGARPSASPKASVRSCGSMRESVQTIRMWRLMSRPAPAGRS